MAHIGEERGLGRVRRLGFKALAQGFVARLFEFPRQVFDLEAQARIFVDAACQPAAVVENLRGEDGNEDRRAMVDEGISEREAKRRHCRDRRETRQEHVHMAGAADDETGEHRHCRASEEDVVELA